MESSDALVASGGASPKTVPGKYSCFVKPRGSPAVTNVIGDFLRAVLDLGDVLEQHGPAGEHADDEIAQLPGVLEVLAGLDADQFIARAEIARRLPDVRAADGPLQFQGGNVVGRHAIRVHEHLNHAGGAADDIGPRHLLDAGEPLGHFLGHAAEGHAVGSRTREREGHDGHVVDFHGFDDPPADARRDDVQIFVDFLLQLDQAAFAVFADIVTDGDDRLIFAAHGVNVFHAVDLIEDLFQGRGHQLFDFRRRVAGKVDKDIRQRNDDLGILLARREPQSRQSHDGRQEDQNEREVRFQENLDDSIGESVLVAAFFAGVFNHGLPPAATSRGIRRPVRVTMLRAEPPDRPSPNPRGLPPGRGACGRFDP